MSEREVGEVRKLREKCGKNVRNTRLQPPTQEYNEPPQTGISQ